MVCQMEPLAQPAIAGVVRKNRFVPERFTKIYLNWLENIRDWCISRQLWWGHRTRLVLMNVGKRFAVLLSQGSAVIAAAPN